MIFLLLTLLLQDAPSPSAARASAELGAIRKDVDLLVGFRDQELALRRKLQDAAGDEAKLRALSAEREALIKDFNTRRDALVARMDGLLKSSSEELRKAPGDAALLDVRREACLLYGRPADALIDTEALFKLRPTDAALEQSLGRLQHQLNRFEPATTTFEALLKRDPKNLEFRRLHATCLFAAHRFAEAQAALEALVKEELPDEARQQAEQYLDMAKRCAEPWKAEQAVREAEKKADDLPRARLTTSRGPIEIELFENEAPNTVANFVELIEKKFYDGLVFHRVIPSFMAQGGCPKGNGTGDAGYRFKDELGKAARHHFRGSLSMANSGPDTNGSQFFITHLPTGWLDGKHTVFGRVIAGQEAADLLQIGDRIVKAEILRKRPHEYKALRIADEPSK
jgi:cyclophilin family peptidyl-prolyl cis-trans isomerase